jgi:hypothetical protein
MSLQSVRPGKFDNVRLHIEYVDAACIGLTRRATSRHSARQIRKLAAAIEQSGFNVPLLVDDQLAIVSGHARLAAARLLGLASVRVIRISHLTPEQLRLFAIFDNRIASEATIDREAVHLELSEIVIEAPELDLTASGFEIAEIDAMNDLHRTQELDDLDEDPEPPRVEVSRQGDLWCLGRHRVICGDSTDAAVIEALVNGRPVRALISDPPYNLKIPGIVSGKGRVKHGDFGACQF